MRIARELAGFSITGGRRSAQGDRQEDPRADGVAQGQVHRGLPREQNVTPGVAKQLWEDVEKAADYSFPKAHAACYALIAYQTAWLRPEPSVRVHGGADQLGDVDEGPRADLRQRVPRARHRSAAARRERVDDRLRRRRRQDPLRPQRRQGRGGGRGERDHRAHARTARSSRSGTSPSASTRSVSNKRVLEALVKCGALPGSRKGMLEVLEQAVGWGQKQQADRLAGQGSIFDLGPVEDEKPRHHPADADRGVREERPAEAREGGARPLRLRASAAGHPRPAAPQDRLRRSASSSGAATARSSRSAASSRRCGT